MRAIINQQPRSRNASLIILIALGGVFVDAYDFTSLGIGVDQLRGEFGLSPFEVGSVTAVMALGALFGALWGGYFTDKIGRYKMFMLDLLFLVFAALGCAFSVNLPMLLVCRFVLGIGVGLDFPVALSFIAEFVQSRRMRGSVALWNVVWFIAAACTGLVVLPFYLAGAGPYLWRIAVGFGAIPALVILALRYRYMSESAPWAAHYLGLDEAAKILKRTYKIDVEAKPEKAEAVSQSPKIGEIFRPAFLRKTIFVSLICATQSMEVFAIGFNLPQITSKLFGGDFSWAIFGAVVFNLFGLVGAILASFASDRIDARLIVGCGYAVVAGALLVFSINGDHGSLLIAFIALATFMLGQAFGPGGQGMTLATVSYPTEIRGIGIGWAQSATRVGSILGFFFFPIMLHKLGFASTMFYLAAAPLLGLFATMLLGNPMMGDTVRTSEAETRSKAILNQKVELS